MSLRAVEKALETSISDGKLHEQAINEYIDKVYPADNSQSERLHEELVKLYNAHSEGKQPPAVLVEGIVRLLPVLTTPHILKNWFESLVPYAVDSSGVNNQLVNACRDFIRNVLNNEETVDSAKKYLEWLIKIYVGDNVNKWIPATKITMERERFIRFNSRSIILESFPRAIETSTNLINHYVLQSHYRLLALQLLSECVSKCDQSKLFKIIDGDLLDTLFKCLEKDQSSAVLTIASTSLAMILPHICDKLVPYLPRIYACFGRLISWYMPEDDFEAPKDWDIIRAHDEDEAPSGENLFMILYGLFPNNTLAFCRASDDYLKKHNYQRPFDDFWNKPAIHHNSAALFSAFLLHPGLIQTTEELELSNNTTRWQSYKSTVDIIMRCVDMRVTSVAGDVDSSDKEDEEEEKTLEALLSEHLRLFKSSMARPGTSSPILGQRSRSSSRPSRAASRVASAAPSRTQSPSGLRYELTQLPFGMHNVGMKPSSGAANASIPIKVDSSDSEKAKSEARDAMSPPPPMPKPPSRQESEDSVSRRARSKSQPPQHSEFGGNGNGLTPMPSATTIAVSSPSLPPVQSGNLAHDGGEFYFRELLLLRNELDFVNFNKYILERKLVQLQKKLSQLDIANIRVDNLVHKNKQLNARMTQLEQENEKTQKAMRTNLKQRTSYESTILEKNKDLKTQVTDLRTQISELEEEITRHRHQFEATEALAQKRGSQVAELELTITRLNTKITEFEEKQRLQTSDSIVGNGGLVKDDINEQDANRQVEITKELYDAKVVRVELESDGLVHDYETRIAHLESESNRYRQLLREQELKLESSAQMANKFDTTRRTVAEIQSRVSEQYETLRTAHDELLKRYSEAERELRARRVHEEERMNELRSTLVTTQPLQSDGDARFELRPRGGRGGVQKR